MSKYIVLGTIPTNDTKVAVGPYKTQAASDDAAYELAWHGYQTEIIPLNDVDDVETCESWAEEDLT